MEALGYGGYHSEEDADVRKGPWTQEEDSILAEYVAIHGEGRWNTAARCAGLKRTGKSCRLRWLNYLRPNVRRGNISLEEQLLILELHSRWGNRWSKIAQYLPGRTDNEIKNYWRTRVQKLAKQLKCDVNSKQFRDTMRYVWMPRLIERIHAAAASSSSSSSGSSSSSSGQPGNTNSTSAITTSYYPTNQIHPSTQNVNLDSGSMSEWVDPHVNPDQSPDCSDNQVSPISDITDCLNSQHPSYLLDGTQNGSGYPGAHESGYWDAWYGQNGNGLLLEGEESSVWESLWANNDNEASWFSTM